MKPGRWAMAMAGALAATAAVGAETAAPGGAARQSYQQERAACMNGSATIDQRSCLREAGAALQESRRGGLSEPDRATLDRNLKARCTYLNGAEREYCERRMSGEGTVSGSVEGGGILRELVVTVPAAEGGSTTGSSTGGTLSAPPLSPTPLPSTPSAPVPSN